jgi:hypothetical protein
LSPRLAEAGLRIAATSIVSINWHIVGRRDEATDVVAELKKLAVERGEQQQITESGPFVSVHFEMS